MVSLNFVKIAADLGIPLSGYAAVSVEIDWLVRHDFGAFAPDPGRSVKAGLMVYRRGGAKVYQLAEVQGLLQGL